MNKTRLKASDWLIGGSPHYRLEKLTIFIEEGHTNQEIAEFLGIHEATFYRWLDKNPQLETLVKDSRRVAIQQVRDSLFKLACGFEYKEDAIYQRTGEIKSLTKYSPPNERAIHKFLYLYDDEFKERIDVLREDNRRKYDANDPLLDLYDELAKGQINNDDGKDENDTDKIEELSEQIKTMIPKERKQ